jgi:hypothetical protein
LKGDAGEGWRRSFGPIMWEIKRYYVESRGEEYPIKINRRKANWIGHTLRRK